MKYIKNILICLIALVVFIPTNMKAIDNVDQKHEVTLYLFYGETCVHCAAEKEFLKEIQGDYDNLNIVLYEVWNNANNRVLYDLVREKMDIEQMSVPLTIIGDSYFVGYGDYIGVDILNKIDEQSYTDTIDVVDAIIKGEDVSDLEFTIIDKNGNITLPWLGTVNAKEFSLPIIAVVLGVIDGFNPCAMWILIFLISMLAGSKDRKKMWILGTTFILTSALVYALIMVAWLNVSSLANSITSLRWFVAVIAIIAGTMNLSSFIKTINTESGCDVVDNSKRKKIIEKIKESISETRLSIAIFGIATLAAVVNIIELSCSAGLPLIFTSILSINELSVLQYGIYIFIYILFFMIDDLIVFSIAMVTFKVTGLSTKYIKYNHIIGAVIMYIIGILLIFKPEWVMFNF